MFVLDCIKAPLLCIKLQNEIWNNWKGYLVEGKMVFIPCGCENHHCKKKKKILENNAENSAQAGEKKLYHGKKAFYALYNFPKHLWFIQK